MKSLPLQRRTVGLLTVIIPLLALFVYVSLRSGPLAPIAVQVIKVELRPITPSIFGIGTVEARHTYKIGPTSAGRIRQLYASVGEYVNAGQVLGEMDPVDLDNRVRSQEFTSKRAEAVLREMEARQVDAQMQARRYEQLLIARTKSEESVATKRQELLIANAAISAAQADLARAHSDYEALEMQRNNLRLISPVDGMVTVRNADPGTTIVAGQYVVEIIDPKSLWVNVRFDQISASGLAAGLSAQIVLRSHEGRSLQGRMLRIEPKADAVTEEILAKVVFDAQPQPLPPIGELAEVIINLPALPSAPIIPNAAVHQEGGKTGVWHAGESGLSFVPIKLGAADLNGYIQVLDGLKEGDLVVVYSEKILTIHSRIHVVERIFGASK